MTWTRVQYLHAGLLTGMARPVCGAGSSMRLSTFPVLQRLPTQRSLVYCPLRGAREGHSIVLQLRHSGYSLTGHIVDSILVTEPVASFHSVIMMVSVVILVHVSQRSIDATLGCHGMATGWKDLGNAGGVEPGFCKPNSRPQPSPSGTDDKGIIVVIYYGNFGYGRGGGCGCVPSLLVGCDEGSSLGLGKGAEAADTRQLLSESLHGEM